MSPPAVRQMTISASPEKRFRLGGDQLDVGGGHRSPFALELAGLFQHAIHAADVQEGLLGNLVEFAVDERLEGLDGLATGT